MKKSIIFLFMAFILAMNCFTSCSSDDDEFADTQVKDATISNLKFTSGEIVMKKYEDVYMPVLVLYAKSGNTDYKLQFLSKSVTREGLELGDDDMVDTRLLFGKNGVWYSYIVGIGYPYQRDEGIINIEKLGSKYKIHIEIPQLNDADGNIIAEAIVYDVITDVKM